MASTIEEIRANIEAAIQPGYRYKLLARGQARAMIWREGKLPIEAPNFSSELSDDLLSYGYSLLLHGLRYVELGGDDSLTRTAFEVSAEALEAVVAKGVEDSTRHFHLLIAAAAYHLGRFSARAYSLLIKEIKESNLSIIELSLAKLMIRDLDGLNRDIKNWFQEGSGDDDFIIETFEQSEVLKNQISDDEIRTEDSFPQVLIDALNGNFMAAIAIAVLSLERGEEALIAQCQERLKNGLNVAGELNLVTQWWCHRLAIKLVDGLWETSFHRVLPSNDPPGMAANEWSHLRKLFISSLYRRGKAEIELWPSQLQAAQRVLDLDVNLVLSLPTSAGKTRIAELCILACLASKKRVVFVTPLRALSAQTEVGLRRTFTPLGKTVSSLYGSIGASGADVDALSSRDIVVATPEKLDFALRSEPTLLDDIGLIILDEGHMIGLGEREVRYEAQIQRLLRRKDAATRRIVCLSAILPDGDQLEDFAGWLTNDKYDGLIKNNWRPTRLRFGDVAWDGESAQLNITVGDEKPFIQKFLIGKLPTKGAARKTFPSDQTELCIATAWRLMDDGQTVLVFCPLRKSVLPFAKKIVEMHKRGHIASVLDQPITALATAITIGEEWFGKDHVVLTCLKLGVAVHHGALPTPYRKEVERLLRDGVLKVTISSPTLAQGLNLAATSLVFHGLSRNKKTIDISEFRNVIGRAGRAYIDVEGLVLYPMFDKHSSRGAAWRGLISNQNGREMESGLVRLIASLMIRMEKRLQHGSQIGLIEYVCGQGAWDFPLIGGETETQTMEERDTWQSHLMILDTAVFSLLGDAQIPDDQIESTLDELLRSSLFQRRLARQKASVQKILTAGLIARAKHIWVSTTSIQRKGYFLSGVGLATGKELDFNAPVLEQLLLKANVAIGIRDEEMAVDAIIKFAEIAFQISPFSPKNLIENWQKILRLWLLGQPIVEILDDKNDEAINFIEQAFVYNLPWAMEAVRVRADAHEDIFSEEPKLSDYSRSYAVAALETGTLSIAATFLIQAGFSSRLAAISAVTKTAAHFDSMKGLMKWLKSDEVLSLSLEPDWPTTESHDLWLQFIEPNSVQIQKPWTIQSYESEVKWHGVPMPPGRSLRLGGGIGKERAVYTADYNEVGTLSWAPNSNAIGILAATATGAQNRLNFEYVGPDDIFVSDAANKQGSAF